ncbi:uncharacterized protein BP5553_08214 [Venustampulla echinocandica]|uniref:Homeo n=1 Tax=Venustampulla echinocandica TaxID=2656787 RepID=A0A370TG17_9HELO|nr:uncharacterized protein BP5553_08214 [Venustampulla echinocandica]RDL33846.1 hypothetical protein BP5553_08214 [Venustampulla echinocandica]
MISSMIRRIVGSSQPSEEPPSRRGSVMREPEHEGDDKAEEVTMETEDKKKKKKKNKKNRKSGEDMELDMAGKEGKQARADITNGDLDLNADGDTTMQMNDNGVGGTAEELKVKKKKNKKIRKKEKDHAELGHSIGPDHELVDEASARAPNGLESPNGTVKVKKHKKARKILKENEATHELEDIASYGVEASPAGEALVAVSAKAKKQKRKQSLVAPGPSLAATSLESTNGLQGNDHTEADREEHENGTPIRPSENALGKRKASQSLPDSTRKTKRKHKGENPPGNDLIDLGLTASSHPNSIQQSNGHRPLQSFAEGLYIQSTKGDGGPSSIPPPETSRIHRPTPTFTPINARRSPSNEETEEPRAPTPELESATPQDPPSPPKSNQKRKRRLPVDESESPKLNIEATPRKPTKGKSTPTKSKTLASGSATPGNKRGSPLTPEDIEGINSAVAMYRDSNRMTQFDVNALIQDTQSGKNPERDELMTFIYDRLPELPKPRIREMCNTRFHNYARGSWTKEEDDELRDAVERFPGVWRNIGPLVNRHPRDARDRWRNNLVCGDKRKKSVWTREEEDQLRAAVAESLEQIRKDKAESTDAQYKAKDDMDLLNWASVSAKMGLVRSRLQCLQKWIRLKDREAEVSPDPAEDQEASKGHWRLEEAKRETQAMSADEILRFLYAVRNSGAAREGKIPWKIVCADVSQEKGRRMVYRFCFKNLRRKITGYKDMEFKDCLEMIISRFEETAPSEPPELQYVGEPDRIILRRNRKKKGEVWTEEELLEKRQRKHVRIRPLGDDNGKASSKKKRKRDANDDEAGVENSEGSSKKQKRKEKPQAISEEYVMEDADEGEQNIGQSVAIEKPSKSKVTKAAASAEQPADGENVTPKQKKKKLRDRMKQHGEGQSQESGSESHGFAPDMSDDIGSAIQSLKKAHKNSRKNKKKSSDNGASEVASDGNPRREVNGDLGHSDADIPPTPNRFNQRHNSLSPDLDTPVKYDGRRHNKKIGSPSPGGDKDEQADTNDPALSDVSSSDGSIPARTKPLEGDNSEDDV